MFSLVVWGEAGKAKTPTGMDKGHMQLCCSATTVQPHGATNAEGGVGVPASCSTCKYREESSLKWIHRRVEA